MQTKETITLSGVPETMLQTVYARAKESSGRGAIRDRKAEETIGGLQYDFSLADRDKAMHSGVIARTIVLDRLTGAWLQEHPGGTVVNVACGLDTRCYRMEGYGRWYNLDLPETIAVRQRLLPENGAISQIAMSAMDDWGGCIAEQDTPALVIIEGLTMYLTETDVQRIFSVIAGALPQRDGAGRDDESHGRQTLPGKVDRGQPCKIHLGREERRGVGRAAAGVPPAGGAQPDGGHGGVCARL